MGEWHTEISCHFLVCLPSYKNRNVQKCSKRFEITGSLCDNVIKACKQEFMAMNQSFTVCTE